LSCRYTWAHEATQRGTTSLALQPDLGQARENLNAVRAQQRGLRRAELDRLMPVGDGGG